MVGDRLIELYDEVHRLRRDANEAEALGRRTQQFQATARLADVQASIDYYLNTRRRGKKPARRSRAPLRDLQLNTTRA